MMNVKIPLLDYGFIELINVVGNDQYIAKLARISRGKTEDTNYEETEKLIKFLLEKEHLSPFEQASATFYVKCPIFVARQWMRHRTGKYIEKSFRYVNAEDIDFYVPNYISKESQEILVATYSLFKENYRTLLDQGLKREIARIIMPVSAYTEFYFCMDLRNLFNFLKLRLDPSAQYEIRVYAEAIRNILSMNQYFPITMKYAKLS